LFFQRFKFSAKKFRGKYLERIWVFHCRYSIRFSLPLLQFITFSSISFVFVDVSLFFWLLNVVCSNLRLWLFFIFVHLRMNKNENLVIELRSMLYKHSTSNFYAIAQQMKWSKPDIFNRHILRLGGFHSLSFFLSSIGKLWACIASPFS
jgi:hypothetical protein